MSVFMESTRVDIERQGPGLKYRRKKKVRTSNEVAKPDTSAKMDVASFLTHNPKRTGTRAKKKTTLEAALEDAEKRAASGDWSQAVVRSFVGLYAMCHRMTYGVDATDLADKGTFQMSTRMVTKVLHDLFNDDKDDLVEFIKWTWEREKGREEWAAREGKSRNRMNVRTQFSASMVTDYRVDQSRRTRRRRVKR